MSDNRSRSSWRLANPFFYIGFAFRRAYTAGVGYNRGLAQQTTELLREATSLPEETAPPIPETDLLGLQYAFLQYIDQAGVKPARLRTIHANLTTAALVLYGLSLCFLSVAGYSFLTDFGVVMGLPVFAIAFMLSGVGSFVRAWSISFRVWQVENVRLGGFPDFAKSWDRWFPWYITADALTARISATRKATIHLATTDNDQTAAATEATVHER